METVSDSIFGGSKITASKIGASLVAQRVKRLPAMQETWVQSLGQEDPLEKEMTTHPVFLPGESHGQRFLAGHSQWSHKQSDMTEQLSIVQHILLRKMRAL